MIEGIEDSTQPKPLSADALSASDEHQAHISFHYVLGWNFRLRASERTRGNPPPPPLPPHLANTKHGYSQIHVMYKICYSNHQRDDENEGRDYPEHHPASQESTQEQVLATIPVYPKYEPLLESVILPDHLSPNHSSLQNMDGKGGSITHTCRHLASGLGHKCHE